MPLNIIREDIVKMRVDAIVNSANPYTMIGGGLDSRIHAFAGNKLFDERMHIGDIKVTEAYITKGYRLFAKHVIHTVGPQYEKNPQEAPQLLKKTYENCLQLALENDIDSIAFPLISSGIYGYPKEEAFQVAKETIENFLIHHDMDIYLVIYDEKSYEVAKKYQKDISNYLLKNHRPHDHYRSLIDIITDDLQYEKRLRAIKKESRSNQYESSKMVAYERNLKNLESELEETFSERLIRLLREKQLDEVKVYQSAYFSRQHFSKMKSQQYYQPTRRTVLALAVAMKLDLDETKDLLASAGLSFQLSSRFDVIIQYFIETKNYDFYEIDTILEQMHQETLRKYE